MKIINFYKILLIIVIILSAIFLPECANIQSPSGGPKDSIPPSIIDAYPLDMVRKFDGNDLFLTFSEWPDRNKVVQNISISPPVDMTYKWSGTRLKIQFLNPLKENTTYSFLLGTEYTDLKGNKPDSSFAITFSTGDVIDSGKIEGMIYSDKAAGAFVYGYKTDDKNIDTLNPEMTAAEFKTQVGNTGNFALRALPDGIYRLIAVKTDFKDNLFHSSSDFFGTTFKDLKVENGISTPAKIQMSKYPNYSPNLLLTSELFENNLLGITFNKPLKNDKSFANYQEFLSISDTLKSKNIKITNVYLDSIISKKLWIKLAEEIDLQKEYLIRFDEGSKISDTSGVILNNAEFKFSPRKVEKKLVFAVNYFPLTDSSKGINFNKEFIFNFTFPILLDSSITNFKMTRLSDNTPFECNSSLIYPNTLKIGVSSELLADNWYRLEFNTKGIRSILGDELKDTIYKFDFLTFDWRTYPSVSGKLLDKFDCGNLIVRLVSLDKSQVYESQVEEKGLWTFSKVKPGKYKIETYCDKNNNSRFDFGKAFPFSFSEKFKYFTNEIEVKERWDVENIMILFDE